MENSQAEMRKCDSHHAAFGCHTMPSVMPHPRVRVLYFRIFTDHVGVCVGFITESV